MNQLNRPLYLATTLMMSNVNVASAEHLFGQHYTENDSSVHIIIQTNDPYTAQRVLHTQAEIKQQEYRREKGYLDLPSPPGEELWDSGDDPWVENGEWFNDKE